MGRGVEGGRGLMLLLAGQHPSIIGTVLADISHQNRDIVQVGGVECARRGGSKGREGQVTWSRHQRVEQEKTPSPAPYNRG